MNFTIIVNQAKLTSYSQGAIKEYEKRLSRYCKSRLILIKKEKELQKYISSSSAFYFIFPSKKTLSSEELASIVEHSELSGQSNLVFLIGFSKDTLEQFLELSSCHGLSISSLHFSADMTAAVLYEQLYRSYRILRKEPYHK